jgi:hypothetical protein
VLAEQVRRLDTDVVQIDEADLPGHPDEWKRAARTINTVLRAVPKSAKAAVHLCFGNYGGQSIQKGSLRDHPGCCAATPPGPKRGRFGRSPARACAGTRFETPARPRRGGERRSVKCDFTLLPLEIGLDFLLWRRNVRNPA